MRVPIEVPEVGAGTETLRLCGWLVDVGDLILKGDLIAEVIIPGVTFEIASPLTGRLVEITCPVDAKIQSGSILGWLEPVDELVEP